MIIAVHNFKGGIGTTMIAAHLCILAREKGLRVAGMSAEFKKELPLFLGPVGIPCVDPDRDEGGDYDLIVVDLHSHKEVSPVPVDAWILPIANRTSLERARELSDRRMGSLVWIGNRRRVTDKDVPRYLRGVVHVAPPIPNSRAIAIAGDEMRHVWHDDELAQSPGGRALRASLEEILAHLGVAEAAAAARAKDDEILSALDHALTKFRVETTTESATPAEEVPRVAEDRLVQVTEPPYLSPEYVKAELARTRQEWLDQGPTTDPLMEVLRPRSRQVLARAGVHTLNPLRIHELLQTPGVGPATLADIAYWLIRLEAPDSDKKPTLYNQPWDIGRRVCSQLCCHASDRLGDILAGDPQEVARLLALPVVRLEAIAEASKKDLRLIVEAVFDPGNATMDTIAAIAAARGREGELKKLIGALKPPRPLSIAR